GNGFLLIAVTGRGVLSADRDRGPAKRLAAEMVLGDAGIEHGARALAAEEDLGGDGIHEVRGDADPGVPGGLSDEVRSADDGSLRSRPWNARHAGDDHDAENDAGDRPETTAISRRTQFRVLT